MGVSGAQALYQTTITLTLSFVVFTFGSLLVAIQVAGGQLTPRIIATTLLRDNVVRYSVGLFVFTLVFAVMALNRLDKTVYDIVSLLTAMLAIACMAMFLFLIDYAARLLRPVSILARVGDEGASVIKAVYPEPASVGDRKSRWRLSLLKGGGASSCTAVVRDHPCGRSRHAGGRCPARRRHRRARAAGGGLRRDRGTAVRAPWRRRVDRDHRAAVAVAFGPERTMEQDPLFAFRIIADIALKALSPAINDPTTGVLALDQLHRLLRDGRSTPAAQRIDCRPSRHASRHLPDTELGGFVAVSCTRDPRVWCQQRADRPAPAGDARQSDLHAARPPARSARCGTPSAQSGDRVALRRCRRTANSPSIPDCSGVGRIVGVPRARPAVMAARTQRRSETNVRPARAARTASTRSDASRALIT